MTLARATVSGKVYRSPEKRFTSNNIAVTDFTLNISEKEEMLIRVVATGNLSEVVANEISKGDMVVAEGRLQLTTVQTTSGAERKVMEINASSLEKLTGGGLSNTNDVAGASPKKQKEQLVEFGTEEFGDDLIGDDEIPF